MYGSQTANRDASFQTDLDAFDRIIFSLGMVFRRQLTQTLTDYQLTPPQFGAMVSLMEHPHGCMMSEVAASVHQVPATMTGIIDRLYERQLVERQTDPKNRRSLLVSLTPQGRSLIEEIKHKQHNHLKNVMTNFSAGERHDLIHLMERYLELTVNQLDDPHGSEEQ